MTDAPRYEVRGELPKTQEQYRFTPLNKTGMCAVVNRQDQNNERVEIFEIGEDLQDEKDMNQNLDTVLESEPLFSTDHSLIS